MPARIKIFSGQATKYLGEQIAASYGAEMGKITITKFADGEFQPAYDENIRGCDIFLIQSTFAPQDNLMELLMLVDAARRASARSIIAVIPYFGFARQDRKDKPRVSIASKMIANLLTASGVNRIITMDLHADQIQGFFDVPVDHMYASSVFIPYLKTLHLPNLTFASPDTGGTRRAGSYAKYFNTDFVICYKHRSKPNVIEEMRLVGDVQDRDVILLDDIVDTAGTLIRAAQVIKDGGARSVRAVVTHPLLSGKAYENINNSALEEVIVTDTIPLQGQSEKIKVVSTADLFAEVLRRLKKRESINSLFKF
ncbi:MAG: ribose-phosphate pyrophosphokinase [Bacteroidota bacterium]